MSMNVVFLGGQFSNFNRFITIWRKVNFGYDKDIKECNRISWTLER